MRRRSCGPDSAVVVTRQAILDANASPGADAIDFSIGGGGAQTITLASILPSVTSPLTIDAFRSAGALPPRVFPSPSMCAPNVIAGNVAFGIHYTSSDTGPFLSAREGRIKANLIGLGADGTTPVPNGAGGIHIEGGFQELIEENTIPSIPTAARTCCRTTHSSAPRSPASPSRRSRAH